MANILLFQKFIHNVSFVWPCIIDHKKVVRAHNMPEQPHIGFKDLSIALYVDSTRTEDVQWCKTAKHYASSGKNFFATNFVDFCYVGGKKSKRHSRLDACRKGQCLLDVCTLFAWKLFFQTRHSKLKSRSPPISSSQYHLFGVDYTAEPLSAPLLTIQQPELEICQLQACQRLFISWNRLSDY
ncbi:hypothetical protein TNCV_3185791 [Trichonephila clavipes]|nr:hypothetical protein TNCV_3185791 [Trichonephila clavipes]